ncbi:hypothetical protein PENNAL_c0137G11045 [Penicillium nalgiovense]|uniref:Uncharacterized protein n=2 Tax=Penicillium TaxID=5073 RepID=A0A1V6X2J1_PENNA|nr:hypothetical protein VN97_g10641 [Penicillium thymicola]OQE69360.1 hypothetical protein PENNAL_c0137G11045 [Penicillium nalgiovense]
MLGDRDAQLDAEESSYGQQSIWRHVYDLMKYDSAACHLGPYCWLDPKGKKHYRLRTQTLRRLVTYAEKGGILETHRDVPDEIKRIINIRIHIIHIMHFARINGSSVSPGFCIAEYTFPLANVYVKCDHGLGQA